MFMGLCFYSHLLYFGVQTGTKTNLFLVVYVYEVVLLVASCTSVYKQAPKQTYLAGLYFFMFMGLLLVEACNLVYKRAPYKPEKKYLPIHRLQITATCLSVQVDV